MRIVYQRCCGMDVHKDSVTACVLLIDEYGEWRSEKRKFRTAAMVNAGPPGPVTTSRTVCPLLISASSTRACVTGANICRMISRCFSQNGAESRHAVITSWSGCKPRQVTERSWRGRCDGSIRTPAAIHGASADLSQRLLETATRDV